VIGILEIKNLTKIYKNNNIEFKVFENLNFKFEENTIYSLVGKSGCGKSTLSHIINMLELPSKGTVCFNGINIISKIYYLLYHRFKIGGRICHQRLK